MSQIVRQKRKSIVITIDNQLEVVVKAPFDAKDEEIEAILLKHQKWIEETKKRRKQSLERKNWILKKEIQYLGKPCKVQMSYHSVKKITITFHEDVFYVELPYLLVRNHMALEEQLKASMDQFLKQQLYKIVEERTKYYANQIGCTFERITIRHQKTRWGSCSSRGSLSYNANLIHMAPPVIDYVVLHEVAHRVHFNHSQDFWNLVAHYMPDYKVYKACLSAYGSLD